MANLNFKQNHRGGNGGGKAIKVGLWQDKNGKNAHIAFLALDKDGRLNKATDSFLFKIENGKIQVLQLSEESKKLMAAKGLAGYQHDRDGKHGGVVKFHNYIIVNDSTIWAQMVKIWGGVSKTNDLEVAAGKISIVYDYNATKELKEIN